MTQLQGQCSEWEQKADDEAVHQDQTHPGQPHSQTWRSACHLEPEEVNRIIGIMNILTIAMCLAFYGV